ncbi:hypothetical protein [Agathobaculum desmolans]|uniref:hypothetical protein n=1 Tax=Agathobaculum desmolans TaxID=39484 RepID=UPI00248F0517|nr:hypothetical protein [Agathobaculum desmolans]
MDNDMLSSLLSDPAALQNAMQAVSGMLGGADSAEPSVSPGYDPTAELMEHALPVIGTIVQSGQSAVRQEKRALLGALKPFVTKEVASQFDHALRLVSIARMARAALGQFGQESPLSGPADHPDPGTSSR